VATRVWKLGYSGSAPAPRRRLARQSLLAGIRSVS
jgi:hypothetical protein